MHATRAAVEEGILPGGGVALLRASEALKKLRTQNDQKTGRRDRAQGDVVAGAPDRHQRRRGRLDRGRAGGGGMGGMDF